MTPVIILNSEKRTTCNLFRFSWGKVITQAIKDQNTYLQKVHRITIKHLKDIDVRIPTANDDKLQHISEYLMDEKCEGALGGHFIDSINKGPFDIMYVYNNIKFKK